MFRVVVYLLSAMIIAAVSIPSAHADPLSDVASTSCSYEQIRSAADGYYPGAAQAMDSTATSVVLRQILAVPPPIRRAVIASSGARADFGDFGWAVSLAAQNCGQY